MYKLAWLAGIVDGEGSLLLSRGRINKRGYYCISTSVNIANTDPRLIIECLNILESLGIYCSVLTNTKKDIPVRKPVWVIKFGGYKRLIKFLDAIEPYLISKKEQAKLMRLFINQRFKGGLTNPYTQKDMDMVDLMHRFKIRTVLFPKSVETKRLVSLQRDSVIVRTGRQLSESAEMTDRLN